MKKLLLSILTMVSLGGSAQIVFVDINATGANDGTSWTDAFTNLQTTFNNLQNNDEVWVAQGVYTPTTSTNRISRFGWGLDSVEVFGGFNGTETSRQQRDWMVNRTILSGDIGVQGDSSDNSYNVCYGPTGNSNNYLTYGLLDGFVIQDGNASDGGDFSGAGIHLAEYVDKFVVNNCEISNNIARHGTAVYAHAFANTKELELNNCIIKNNKGRWGVGIELDSQNKNLVVKISNCLYENNIVKDMSATLLGTNSIIYMRHSTPGSGSLIDLEIVNTTFANNKNIGTAPTDNEGVIQYYASHTAGIKNLKLFNTIFWGNTGDTKTIVTHQSSVGGYDTVEFHNCISDFSDFSDATATSNILNADPLFTDAVNKDFTLQNGSPAIDIGTVTNLTIPLTDLAGNTRVLGSQIDLGCYEFGISTCTVNIPDANFKAYLIGNTAINTNGDTEIQCAEATSYTGHINCNSSSVSDLTGIEAFTALTQLYCSSNNLANLDVSHNTDLFILHCSHNNLSNLNVNLNTALTSLKLANNNISTIDVTNNTLLNILDIGHSNISNIDLTNNLYLEFFDCNNTNITSLNLSQNSNMESIDFANNNITSIDVSLMSNLYRLRFDNTPLTSLDLSQNSIFKYLYCDGSTITSLDLSQNTALILLDYPNGALTNLNLANGTNASITNFDVTNNPNLSCIQVDDATYSTTNWTNIDATASFSTNCNMSTGINETTQSLGLTIYPNPVANQLNIENGELKIESILILDITGETVKTIVSSNNTIDVSDLTKGIYFIQIQTENGLVNSKFIKD